jgi:hypothetical protein
MMSQYWINKVLCIVGFLVACIVLLWWIVIIIVYMMEKFRSVSKK